MPTNLWLEVLWSCDLVFYVVVVVFLIVPGKSRVSVVVDFFVRNPVVVPVPLRAPFRRIKLKDL